MGAQPPRPRALGRQAGLNVAGAERLGAYEHLFATMPGMGQVVLPDLGHRKLAGVETGADFALRFAQRAAGGVGPLPVTEVLQPLFSGAGFERGHIYGIAGDAPLSLLFALVARATGEGSWLALVNLQRAGLLSAHEHGVALHRTVCVEVGSSSSSSSWSHAVGALVDGFDFVVVSSPACSMGEARRIAARVKAQGSVLLVVGNPGAFDVDATFGARTVQWQFNTYASARTVHVSARGRRVHGDHSCTVQLPAATGAVCGIVA